MEGKVKLALMKWAGRMLLLILSVLFLTPLVWMFLASVRPQADVFRYITPFTWKTLLPSRVTLSDYKLLFSTTPFLRYVFNTAFVAIVATVLNLFVNSLAAYAFARMRFPGRDLIFVMLLTTLVIPFEIISIPLYSIVRTLGWIDTYQALIFPSVARVFSIFLLKQFFSGIPAELEEAARIDGCSAWGIYRNVILPLGKPALITLALLSMQENWDSFIWPLIVTNSPGIRVIQIAIASFAQEGTIYWELIFPACSIAAGIPIILYMVFQRYYVQGIATTGLKG